MPHVLFYLIISLWSFRDRTGEALKLLLEKGFDPNARHLSDRSTPLHLAVKRKNETAVRILTQCPECNVDLQVRGFLWRYQFTWECKSVTLPLISASIACIIRTRFKPKFNLFLLTQMQNKPLTNHPFQSTWNKQAPCNILARDTIGTLHCDYAYFKSITRCMQIQ